MKHLNQDKLSHRNDRIDSLLAELNSALELYYEPVIEKEVSLPEH